MGCGDDLCLKETITINSSRKGNPEQHGCASGICSSAKQHMRSHNMCDDATELMALDSHAFDQCEFANDVCSSAEQHACALEVCDHALTPLATTDDHYAPSIMFAERYPCTHGV